MPTIPLGAVLPPPANPVPSDLYRAGICFLCIIYTYFRVPEPQGRTFAELDLLFKRGVSARKFAATKVDVFDEAVAENVVDDYVEKTEVVRGLGAGKADVPPVSRS